MHNIPDKGDSPYPDLPEITIHPDGVRKLLHNINPHKATRPDNIPGQLLKEVPQEVMPILSLIFSASLHQGRISDEWKEATVTPFFSIDQVAMKANITNAFLHRNISTCPSKIKEQCYRTMVRPIMEYACVVLDPVTQKDTHKTEMVQRRVKRFV